MAEYDNLCKILAEKYPHDFIRWLLNEEPRTVKILKTELSIEPIRADSVTFLKTEKSMKLFCTKEPPKTETVRPGSNCAPRNDSSLLEFSNNQMSPDPQAHYKLMHK